MTDGQGSAMDYPTNPDTMMEALGREVGEAAPEKVELKVIPGQ